ncbi:phosphoglycerate mutase family protein [Enterococcus cecorum]
MTRFYFLRHGITEINEQRRFNGGRVDSPLTPEGIEQTKKIATIFC